MKTAKSRLKKNFMYVFLVSFTLFFIVFFCLDTFMRPQIVDYSSSKAKNFVSASIHETLANTVKENNFTYSDMVTVSKNSKGNITSIQTNTMNVNLLKAQAVKQIGNRLENYRNQSFQVPLGTLVGWQFVTGKGPKVSFDIQSAGNVNAQLHNSFTSAGINQTKHQIILTVTVDVVVLFPGYSTTVNITTDFIVADTIIVGEIPDTYLDFSKNEQDILSKPNEYAIND